MFGPTTETWWWRRDGLAPQLKHGGGGVVKHGGGGVMVWGCFSANGVGKLRKVDGTINSDYYSKILKFCAIPSFKQLHPNGNCFSKIMLPVILQRMLKSGLMTIILKLCLGQEIARTQ